MTQPERQTDASYLRARNRLIGAIILVVLAIIIVPVVLKVDTENRRQSLQVTYPNGLTTNNAKPVAATVPGEGREYVETPAQTEVTENAKKVEVPVAQVTEAPKPERKLVQNEPTKTEKKPVAPIQKVEKKTTPKKTVKPTPEANPTRDQDGAEALAILEGRKTPVATQTASRTAYYIQLAAFKEESYAKQRLRQLQTNGISNGYIEPAVIRGQKLFRLRIGPFVQKKEADAVLKKAAALGYKNSKLQSFDTKR
ncbi:SPOR domain-containing protein [Basilea psittacipulmonis]|uniref:SPOR domain-containing protein n=1 Tax=Basilea psittacipulmonis DSM 24701 TaxID=1072685 RepID=A0A077DEN0_9BURK|nr:SPOR domain-containing protein [Basilea psittacipulmonis]AIL32621.1 hypothetical protein IX83_04255 [Basilea psittacipulmonis DSM 24701]